MYRLLPLLCVATLALMGCAKRSLGGGSSALSGLGVPGFVTLYSWGNEGCGACKTELGEITAFLNSHPDIRSQVITVLYVPSGDPDLDYTPESAKSFHDVHAPGFLYQMDKGWVKFQQYVGDQGTVGNLPADVIVDKKGKATVYTSQTTVPTGSLITSVIQGLVNQP